MQRTYVKEISKSLGFVAGWLPSTQFAVGMVGPIRNGVFHPETTLDNLGYPYEVREDNSRASYEHSSKGVVSVDVKLAGATPKQGSLFTVDEAGLAISFKRENAVFFQAYECRTRRIDDVGSLGLDVLIRHRDKRWDPDMCVVTETLVADRGNVVVANGNDAVIEILCEGTVPTGAETLLDAKASFVVRQSKQVGFKAIAERELTPMFRLYGLKWGILGRSWRPKHALADGEAVDEEPSFLEFDADDLG